MDTLGSLGEQSEISSALQCLPWAPCTQVRTTAQLSNNQTAANKTDEFLCKQPPFLQFPVLEEGDRDGHKEETSLRKNYQVPA